jgi:hypothetical protein
VDVAFLAGRLRIKRAFQSLEDRVVHKRRAFRAERDRFAELPAEVWRQFRGIANLLPVVCSAIDPDELHQYLKVTQLLFVESGIHVSDHTPVLQLFHMTYVKRSAFAANRQRV